MVRTTRTGREEEPVQHRTSMLLDCARLSRRPCKAHSAKLHRAGNEEVHAVKAFISGGNGGCRWIHWKPTSTLALLLPTGAVCSVRLVRTSAPMQPARKIVISEGLGSALLQRDLLGDSSDDVKKAPWADGLAGDSSARADSLAVFVAEVTATVFFRSPKVWRRGQAAMGHIEGHPSTALTRPNPRIGVRTWSSI